MSFLHPALLAALPVILIPLLVHLFYRRRFRRFDWGAMHFLRQALRERRGRKKLRDALILTFRSLALASLVLAASQPLFSGQLGRFFRSGPRDVILLLDRSSAMEGKLAGKEATLRHSLLRRFREDLDYRSPSRVVVIDSATRQAHELSSPANLQDAPNISATDSQTSLPDLLEAGWRHAQALRETNVEFWLGTSRRSASWRLDDPRWPSLVKYMGDKLRVLALPGPSEDRAISVSDVTTRVEGERLLVSVNFQIDRVLGTSEVVPITLQLAGPRTVECMLNGESTKLREQVSLPLPSKTEWGFLELPVDGNDRNNRAYFVFAPPKKVAVLLTSTPGEVQQALIAAANPTAETALSAKAIPAEDLSSSDLQQAALLIWQSGNANPSIEHSIHEFVESGGQVLLLPNGQPSSLLGCHFREIQTGEFRVNSWRHDSGPLANASGGERLVVDRLSVQRRQVPVGDSLLPLAKFEDGSSMLVGRHEGEGMVHACATLPSSEWSNLADGPVLVPLLQRLIATGSARLSGISSEICGSLAREKVANAGWRRLTKEPAQPGLEVAVWAKEKQTLLLSRDERERQLREIEQEEMARLLPSASFGQIEHPPSAWTSSPLGRALALCMIALLLAEAISCLPAKSRSGNASAQASPLSSV